jgi:nitrate/TMAO reductase-like tetraheme cytochrome c subunit
MDMMEYHSGFQFYCFLLVAGLFLIPSTGRSQFSPGDLSRAHHQFEGTQNCVKCHEVGKEISGQKCLGCHTEIASLRNAGRGFHARNASQQCIACHKEHLGIDAATMKFDSTGFDHNQSGYPLDGKHQAVACAACHNASFIRDTTIVNILKTSPHRTYLGLNTNCNTCHQDPHKGKFRQTCGSCHSTERWGKIHGFDHSTTKFPLTGKHGTVACSKCHTSMKDDNTQQKVDFTTKAFADCTPCHTTPHRAGFDRRTCTSCHITETWSSVRSGSFDHSLTSYALEGRHQRVECASCHAKGPNRTYNDIFRPRDAKCSDCHADRHDGVFTAKYSNDCAVCHSVAGYSPSRITSARHSDFKFALTGGHLAIPCVQCHKPKGEKSRFRFDPLECATCHADVHKGQFDHLMQGKSCGSCHSTGSWKPAEYNHAATAFPLEGKHATTSCASCHKEITGTSMAKVKFLKLQRECSGCHPDNHAMQFDLEGVTNCATCHTALDWKPRLFNHDAASTFHLTGGHKNVPCGSCHRPEEIAGKKTIRYKPISAACSFCHQGKEMKP